MRTTEAQSKLVELARKLSTENKDLLDRLKANHADISRPDFLWHYLLQSFATMGRSSGWNGLIGNQTNYNRITYPAIETLSPVERPKIIQDVCRAAKIRMPDIKAVYILKSFEWVQSMGGPEAAKANLLAQPDRAAKISWLKRIPGIGDKYARNIMMDVYHEDFRDSIAIDARIKSVTKVLGITFSSYKTHEEFYLSVARLAGLNGWELDRLLYHFVGEQQNQELKLKNAIDHSSKRPKLEDYILALQNEFEAGNGSFLIQLRVELNWDKAAFTRLITAMEKCCEEFSGTDSLERWMANGFWYVPRFVRDWTMHANFPQVHEPEYYQQAYQRLDDLAYWFFFGESPYQEGIKFEPM